MASAGGRELTADDDPWRVSAFISALMELVLSVLLLLGATIAFITAQLVKFFGLEPPCTYIGCSHNLLADSSKRRRHAVCRFHHLKEDCDCCPDCGASWGYAKLHSEEFSSTNDDTDGCLLPDREHSRDLSALTSDLDVRDHHVVDEDPHGSYDSALQLGQKRPCLCFASSSRIYRKPGRPKYAKLEASIFGCNGTAEEERVPLFSMRSVSACSSHSDAEDHSEMSSTSTGNQKKPISQKEKCLQKETLADGDASIHSSEGVSRNSEDEHHYMLLEGEDEEIYEAPFCNSFESISRDPKGEHCYMLLQGEGEDIPEGEPFYMPLEGEGEGEGEGEDEDIPEGEGEPRYMPLEGEGEDEDVPEGLFLRNLHPRSEQPLLQSGEGEPCYMPLEGEDEDEDEDGDEDIPEGPFLKNLHPESEQPLLQSVAEDGLEGPNLSKTFEYANEVANVVGILDSLGPSDIEQAMEDSGQCEFTEDSRENTCTSAGDLSSRSNEVQFTGALSEPLKASPMTESIMKDEILDVCEEGHVQKDFSDYQTNTDCIQGSGSVKPGNSDELMVGGQVGRESMVKVEDLDAPLVDLSNIDYLEEKKEVGPKSLLFHMENEFMVLGDLHKADKIQERKAFESGSEIAAEEETLVSSICGSELHKQGSSLQDVLAQDEAPERVCNNDLVRHFLEAQSIPLESQQAIVDRHSQISSNDLNKDVCSRNAADVNEVSTASDVQGAHEDALSKKFVEGCSILDDDGHETEVQCHGETISEASVESVIQEAMDQYLVSFRGCRTEDRPAGSVSSLENIDTQQGSVGRFENLDVVKGNRLAEENTEKVVLPLQAMKIEQDKEETALEEDSEEGSDALREALRAERKILAALETELENERNAAAIATSEAMAMISRLQEEKSAMQMEVTQLQRMSEERADYDEKAMELLKEILFKREKEKHALEKEVEMYRERLLAEKFDTAKKNSTPVLLLRETDEEHESFSPEGRNGRLPSLEEFYDPGITSSPHRTSMGQSMGPEELSPQSVELKETNRSNLKGQAAAGLREDKGDFVDPFIGEPDRLHGTNELRGTSRSIFSTTEEETQFILERLWVLEEELQELRGQDGLGAQKHHRKSTEVQHLDGSPTKRRTEHSCTNSCSVRCIDGEIGGETDENGAGMFLPVHDVYEVQLAPNHHDSGQEVEGSDALKFSETMLEDFEASPTDISQEYLATSRQSHRPQVVSHTRRLSPPVDTNCDSALIRNEDIQCADDSHTHCLKATDGRLVTADVLQQLAGRLQALETDRKLLREILDSFKHRDAELNLLREISQHLRELRMAGYGRASAGGELLEGPFSPTFGKTCARALKKRRYCGGPGQTQLLLLQQKSI